VRILVADGNPEVRAALHLVLDHAGHTLTGEALDMVGLMAKAAADCPDAIILDVDLPGLSAGNRHAVTGLLGLLNAQRRLRVGSRLIALSSSPEAGPGSIAAGADAFFCKSDPPDGLLRLLAGFSSCESQP
jgi:CheY-like chemotaxis protein